MEKDGREEERDGEVDHLPAHVSAAVPTIASLLPRREPTGAVAP